ncbi:unnamed protein product [Closterium sp. Naga37s-1]|nr:unnamed protein product [Closterium sp. Naga37s-1]
MAKQSHNEDDDCTSSRVSDSMILSSGHGNMDGEKGSDGGDTRDGVSNMRRAATDLPRTKSPYTRRSAYLTGRQRAAVASRFYNELKRNTLVGDDYKVQIQTDNFPRELQEEFLHMFAQPQDQAGREGEVIAPRAAESVGKLNICILIVGTRGDVQPFIAIGQKLKVRRAGGKGRGLGWVGVGCYGHCVRLMRRLFKLPSPLMPSAFTPHGRATGTECGWRPTATTEAPQTPPPLNAIRPHPPWQGYGHRVRLASHSNYREFVTAGGLEFYPLGGDPKVLAEYMVKNKGFLPSSRKEVLQQRRQLKSIIFSTWPACTQPDVASNGPPFRADAIIANPPVYGHTTVAEALQVPLHLFFTMPWSMTTEYPHPLAGEMPAYTGYENQLSYVVVEGLMWLGVRDFINSFRKKLKLPPIPLRNRPKMRIPFGYIWSPTLAPKPHDWGNLIDVVGFCFLNLAEHYSPPAHIQQWLDSGPPPIFIGFGSLPVSDPKGLTQKFVEALQRTGQRGILQEGWGGLGKMETPNENVLVIGNCPHDWLFPRCRAVLHHGGAGTTAAGLKAACPTTIIPFFGDQPFWGARVHAAGVGPEPIPIGSLTLDKIVAAIEFMIRDEPIPIGSLTLDKIVAAIEFMIRDEPIPIGSLTLDKIVAAIEFMIRDEGKGGSLGPPVCMPPPSLRPLRLASILSLPGGGSSEGAGGQDRQGGRVDGAVEASLVVAAARELACLPTTPRSSARPPSFLLLYSPTLQVVVAAKELAGKIAREDGVDGAVEAFHKHLPPGYHSQEQCTPWLEASPGADYGSDCSCWPWSCGEAGEAEAEEEKKS